MLSGRIVDRIGIVDAVVFPEGNQGLPVWCFLIREEVLGRREQHCPYRVIRVRLGGTPIGTDSDDAERAVLHPEDVRVAQGTDVETYVDGIRRDLLAARKEDAVVLVVGLPRAVDVFCKMHGVGDIAVVGFLSAGGCPVVGQDIRDGVLVEHTDTEGLGDGLTGAGESGGEGSLRFLTRDDDLVSFNSELIIAFHRDGESFGRRRQGIIRGHDRGYHVRCQRFIQLLLCGLVARKHLGGESSRGGESSERGLGNQFDRHGIPTHRRLCHSALGRQDIGM